MVVHSLVKAPIISARWAGGAVKTSPFWDDEKKTEPKSIKLLLYAHYGSMGRTVYLPTNLPYISTIHVGKYTIFPRIRHGMVSEQQKVHPSK